MAQVSIVMGSDSDMPVMAKAAEIWTNSVFPMKCGLFLHIGCPILFLNMHRPRRSGA